MPAYRTSSHAGRLAGKIGLMVKHTNRLASETAAWGYLIVEAIAGAVFLLLSAYEIFFRK
jgi:hypothetical protein